MPLIDIHVMEGVFSSEEKAEIIKATVKAFGSVAGSAMQSNTSCRVPISPRSGAAIRSTTRLRCAAC